MMNIEGNQLFIDSDKMVYKFTKMRQLQDKGLGFLLSFELVAGWDYLDNGIQQGFVPPDRFVGDVQLIDLTFYPLEESLEERLNSEEMRKFKDYDLLRGLL